MPAWSPGVITNGTQKAAKIINRKSPRDNPFSNIDMMTDPFNYDNQNLDLNIFTNFLEFLLEHCEGFLLDT